MTGKQSTPTATLSAADFTSHSVSAQVTSLQPGMTYHFLLVATYGAAKTVTGATTQTLTTHAVTAPTATTLAAEGFKETEATLKGTVNPGGEATEYFFEYGTDTHYGQKTEKATLLASGGNQTVSAPLTKGSLPTRNTTSGLSRKTNRALPKVWTTASKRCLLRIKNQPKNLPRKDLHQRRPLPAAIPRP